MLRTCVWGLLLGSILIGCGRSPKEPPGTGARECVQGYYEALIQQDWMKAYAALDPQSQDRCSPRQFTELAQTYHNSLGFEPESVHVRACEERDGEATAHVVLTGRTATEGHRYKDGVVLRRSADGWRIVLPPNFGQAKKQ